MELKILFIIATLFLFGAVIIFISSLVMQDKSSVRGLWTIYLTEFVIVGLVLLPAFVGGAFFAGVMGLVGLGALWEFYALYGKKFPMIFKVVGGVAGLALFASAYSFDHTTQMLTIIPLTALFLLSINIFMPVSPEISKHVSLTLLGIIYHQRPVTIIHHQIIIRLKMISQHRQGFMPRRRHQKQTLPLTEKQAFPTVTLTRDLHQT